MDITEPAWSQDRFDLIVGKLRHYLKSVGFKTEGKENQCDFLPISGEC